MGPEPERRETRELEEVNESLRRRELIHATELEVLQQVATQLVTARGMDALYGQILDTALAILHADLASIQKFCPERGIHGQLKLLGHRGFSAEAARHWEWVGPDSRTTCAEALRTGRRIGVPDVRNCSFLAGSEDLDGYLGAGIRSAQTFPLVSRSGVLLGMVSVYWRDTHEMSATEVRALDILARLAADVIERARAEEALRDNQRVLASIYDTVRDVIFHLAVEPEGQFRSFLLTRLF
jgi:GAF domain-containing protein